MERTVQRMADLLQCPICGQYLDKELVEDGFAICPYCENEVEIIAKRRLKSMSVIEFAEKRYKECCDNGLYEDARYWAAYLDGARAQRKEDADNG